MHRMPSLITHSLPLHSQSHHVSGPFLPVLAAYIEAGAVASTSAEVFSALVTYFQEQARREGTAMLWVSSVDSTIASPS